MFAMFNAGKAAAPGAGRSARSGARAAWLLAAAAALLCRAEPTHSEANYRLPYDVGALRARAALAPPDAARPCPALIPAPVSLQHQPRYRNDGTASVVDPALAAAEAEATRPVREFNRLVTTTADAALRSARHGGSHAACVIRHLDHWAASGAFLGTNSMQGEFEKKWGAIAYALAFMETGAAATPEQAQRITRWLRRLGTDVHAHYSLPVPPVRLSSRHNNHAYWAALSCATVGMAVKDPLLFEWGMARFLGALGDIDAQGFLPRELDRASRALGYHVFALGPLLLLDAIARANGVEVPAHRTQALRRLVAKVAEGLDDNTVFERATGHVQVDAAGTDRGNWAWAELALGLYPDAGLEAAVAARRPHRHVWLGGDLTLRYAGTRAPAAALR